jgi:hypothetical protein
MNIRLKPATALGLVAILALSACKQQAEEQAADRADAAPAAPAETVADAAPAALGSGIDMSGFDTGVRPQDDFFDHVNGKWVAETPLPADRARWGTFDMLRENAQKDVRVRGRERPAGQRHPEDPRLL